MANAKCLSNYEYLKPNKPTVLKTLYGKSLTTILYPANLHMKLRTDQMVFFGILPKIDTDENKAIYSIFLMGMYLGYRP